MELVPRDTSVTVGTSVIEVSAETGTAQRRVIVLTNVSTAGQIISLAVGKDAVANKGLVLYPTGAWSETIDPTFKPTNQRITAISSAAGGTLAIHERVD
jgi:hypothetical protein